MKVERVSGFNGNIVVDEGNTEMYLLDHLQMVREDMEEKEVRERKEKIVSKKIGKNNFNIIQKKKTLGSVLKHLV